jgi:hypothetical protein
VLTVGEQIPGTWLWHDITKSLETNKYFASYNVPMYDEIWKASGYGPCFEKQGNECSWAHCARANIFRSKQAQVKNLEDFKSLMRYNEYQTDPNSLKDACRGIAARCDLNTPWDAKGTLNGVAAFGAIDCKVGSSEWIPLRQSLIVAGPTWDTQPPFAWTKRWATVPHFGQPTVFAFDWVTNAYTPLQ